MKLFFLFTCFIVLIDKWKIIKSNESTRFDFTSNSSKLFNWSSYNFEALSWTDGLLTIVESVDLYLYSQNDLNIPYKITPGNVRHTPLDVNCPVEVIIHGWGGDSYLEWVNTLKDTFLDVGCYNVIVVDWGVYTFDIYMDVIRNAPRTGAYIGLVLIKLNEFKNIKMESIRIRGFSLGAHVAGYIGKIVYVKTGLKVGRITALDPAGIFFERLDPNYRLDSDDALFTDVIHTSGLVFGLMKSIGHADFYPNGGGLQKCSPVCSHKRSHAYFIESVTSRKFLSTSCDSWKNFKNGKCNNTTRLLMGFHLDTEIARGKYFLKINKLVPYALG